MAECQTSFQAFFQPIAFPNREVESVYQLVDSLELLEKLVEGVFSSITRRVTEEKSKVDAIGSRVAIAREKVEKISGTTKAITVQSSAKYPSLSDTDYRPLYVGEQVFFPKHSSYHISGIPHSPTVQVKDPLLDDPYLPESLPQPKEEHVKEGLGRLPGNTSSLSSLLLFNTQENPYKKYISLDNLAGKEPTELKEEHHNLPEAPTTLGSDLEGLRTPGALEYGYKPVLGAVPEFNLPSVLPDLPMVADISWGASDIPEFTPIAPSTQSHLPDDLPDIVDHGSFFSFLISVKGGLSYKERESRKEEREGREGREGGER